MIRLGTVIMLVLIAIVGILGACEKEANQPFVPPATSTSSSSTTMLTRPAVVRCVDASGHIFYTDPISAQKNAGLNCE